MIAYGWVGLVALGWGLRGLNWRQCRREPWPSTVLAVGVVVAGAAAWPATLVSWLIVRGALLRRLAP